MCLLLGVLSVTGGYSRSDGSVSCESCDGGGGRGGGGSAVGSEGGRYGSVDSSQANPSSLC